MMSKTIVALFNEKSEAEKARQDLIRTGLQQSGIRVEDYSSTDISSRFRNLKSIGVPERHAEAYCEGLRRGGGLLIASVDETSVPEARNVLQRDGAVNVDQRVAMWQQDGWDHFDAKSKPFTAEEAARERKACAMKNGTMNSADNTHNTNTVDKGTFTIPVVEEQIDVGKREVEQGGVRVRQHVTERPVEEKIQLREEHVNVDRHKVDRPISDADMRNMKDQTIELTEHREEPVVQKQARVKEEVTLSKSATKRTETVRDTVRTSDVDIDHIDDTPRSTGSTATRNSTDSSGLSRDMRRK
jgi:stress response protein YsnF